MKLALKLTNIKTNNKKIILEYKIKNRIKKNPITKNTFSLMFFMCLSFYSTFLYL